MNVDHLPIQVRAFTRKPTSGTKRAQRIRNKQPSRYDLVFDTETKIDVSQSLRVGAYQVRDCGNVIEAGFFYRADALTGREPETLAAYCMRRGLKCLPLKQFVDEVFYLYGYRLRGNIIGFNLPFDLSRLALSWDSARNDRMRGGYTLQFSKDPAHPNVRVKSLGTAGAKFDFASNDHKDNNPNRPPPKRGFFTDISTLANALYSRRFSLGSLCEQLETETRKIASEEHGEALSETYLDYAMNDVQATWECHARLIAEYENHQVPTTAQNIFSEASLGKAYLKKMGVSPLAISQREFSPGLMGELMSAYFGGRTEVHIRRQVEQVCVVDFKAMYPTVNALQGLWEFVKAKTIGWKDSTEETQAFLDHVTANDFQNPSLWRKIRTVVKLKPNSDRFPIRAVYHGDTEHTALNTLTSDETLVYTLADCVVSKLMTGKAPKIEAALTFEVLETQDQLQPINLFGDERFGVDPNTQDPFVRFVQLRDMAKREAPQHQLAIKIILNAMAYGIYVEMNPDKLSEKKPLEVYDHRGRKRIEQTKQHEYPGSYFHPLVATLTTGAARLMLALAQTKAAEQKLDWVFCDTDSLALAKPKELNVEAFYKRVKAVTDWFIPLDPYSEKDKRKSILNIEKENYHIKQGAIFEPLFCFAVASKRYCLFNLDKSGKPIIRKATILALGLYHAPYKNDDPPKSIPAPLVSLEKLGLHRWQYDFWYQIVSSALAGDPDNVDLSYHRALQKPAMRKYSASTPHMLGWFKPWNKDQDHTSKMVRPFNFLSVFSGKRTNLYSAEEIMPVAPFRSDPLNAAKGAFCRQSEVKVEVDQLETYVDVLCDYHLSAEMKFRNGAPLETGPTRPRDVRAQKVILVGKETTREDGSTERARSIW